MLIKRLKVTLKRNTENYMFFIQNTEVKIKKHSLILKICIILFLLILSNSYKLYSQTTITKQGQNYWGGAYVAPTWTKTYKDYTPSKSSNSSGFNTSNYKSSINSNTSNHSGTENINTPKTSGYKSDPDASYAIFLEKKRIEMLKREDAKKQAKKFFEKLDEAKDLILRQKLYYNGLFALTNDMKKIYDDAANLEASDEYNILIHEYYTEVHYYIFLSGIKLGIYEYPAEFYKYNFTIKDTSSNKNTEMILPLSPGNYFFMNEGSYNIPKAFYNCGNLTLSSEERLKVDLLFVQLLLGNNKNEDAKNALKHIIKFYEPIVPDFSYIADELALIYFKLGEMDLAQKNIEYYCEYRKSNYYRHWLISNLLEDNEWNGKDYPESINFLERNFSFLEELQNGTLPDSQIVFNDREWYILYTQKSNNPKAYVERKKKYLKVAELDPKFSWYGDNYLTALLRINDEVEINRVLLKLKALGLEIAKNNIESSQQKLDNLIAEYKGFSVKKDYEKDAYVNCWNRYYKLHAKLTMDVLFYFGDIMLEKFYKNGGRKYVYDVIGDEIKYLNQFTIDELSTTQFDCLKLGIKKPRNYPKVFDPTDIKLEFPASHKKIK